MEKRPYRLKFEDRGFPRRQWVAYRKDGTQLLIFAPGQYLRSVLMDITRMHNRGYI